MQVLTAEEIGKILEDSKKSKQNIFRNICYYDAEFIDNLVDDALKRYNESSDSKIFGSAIQKQRWVFV